MKKLYKQIIERCIDCPHIYQDDAEPWCMLVKKADCIIKDELAIQSWCPLDDTGKDGGE